MKGLVSQAVQCQQRCLQVREAVLPVLTEPAVTICSSFEFCDWQSLFVVFLLFACQIATVPWLYSQQL